VTDTATLMQRLPPDCILLPYSGENSDTYEHGFAAFAHGLLNNNRVGPAGKSLIQTSSLRFNGKLTFVLLSRVLVAWHLDTNRTTICRALILLERNSYGRRDVWSSDSPELALTMFKSL